GAVPAVFPGWMPDTANRLAVILSIMAGDAISPKPCARAMVGWRSLRRASGKGSVLTMAFMAYLPGPVGLLMKRMSVHPDAEVRRGCVQYSVASRQPLS